MKWPTPDNWRFSHPLAPLRDLLFLLSCPSTSYCTISPNSIPIRPNLKREASFSRHSVWHWKKRRFGLTILAVSTTMRMMIIRNRTFAAEMTGGIKKPALRLNRLTVAKRTRTPWWTPPTIFTGNDSDGVESDYDYNWWVVCCTLCMAKILTVFGNEKYPHWNVHYYKIYLKL